MESIFAEDEEIIGFLRCKVQGARCKWFGSNAERVEPGTIFIVERVEPESVFIQDVQNHSIGVNSNDQGSKSKFLVP